MFGVCVCVLRHAEKNVVKTVFGFKHASVCTFKTCIPAPRAHVSTHTCARGAGTHGDVLNVHTEAFLNPHTEGRGVIVSSAYQNLPTYGNHLLQRFTKETFVCIFPTFNCEHRLRTTCPDSSNHSLAL